MNRAQQLLADTAASGQLSQALERWHQRWRHFWDFDDFSDQVLTRAWEMAAQFRGQTAEEFLAWLRRIAWRAGIDRWRHERRRDSVFRRLLAMLPSFAPSPEAVVDTRDLVQWLLAGLNDRERKVLVLKYYQGHSINDIAAALECSPAAVHQLHHRALTKLRIKVGKGDFFS